jgi:DNA-directed RNA polymerase subunit RPC12/RpoP
MTTLLIPLSLGMLAVLAVVGYRFLRSRSAPETVFHARCPECQQKVRYSARMAGRRLQCPRCHSRLSLPADPQPPTAAPSSLRVGQRLPARKIA